LVKKTTARPKAPEESTKAKGEKKGKASLERGKVEDLTAQRRRLQRERLPPSKSLHMTKMTKSRKDSEREASRKPRLCGVTVESILSGNKRPTV